MEVPNLYHSEDAVWVWEDQQFVKMNRNTNILWTTSVQPQYNASL
jgi:hypothetical protein